MADEGQPCRHRLEEVAILATSSRNVVSLADAADVLAVSTAAASPTVTWTSHGSGQGAAHAVTGTISGSILCDLTIVNENRHRGRVAAALGTAPNGATVELLVGPLRVTPDAVRLVRQYVEERGLHITVKGEVRAVQAWVLALRSGELLGLLL